MMEPMSAAPDLDRKMQVEADVMNCPYKYMTSHNG